ncbi:MAG: YiiX/YebB-like N1pC/P60 family cysteine hydrolase [Acidocella sp.]|nr:YiiX/YebB-like N1pC/P60 family cysteine hydrolase [Acidocella sp.]
MNKIQTAIGTAIAHVLTVPITVPPNLPVDIAAFRALLLPGDVILVEGDHRLSAAIKYLTQSTWSHAALFVGPQGEGAEPPDCVEADIKLGVRLFRLEELLQYHVRVCRPVGLRAEGQQAVVDFVLSKIGTQYDLRYVFDLARYLVPLPIPRRWRRKAISLGSGDPTRAICSTLIAQAFLKIGYPILPDVTAETVLDEAGRARVREIYHIHENGLFVPRDFDISPFFQVIKPEMPAQFDYHKLVWGE